LEIKRYSDISSVEDAIDKNEPLLAIILFDGSEAVVSHIDEAVEHHILLAKAGYPSGDIDKFFRIVFDRDGADWTFVCPSDYKNISDRQRRVAQFYKDGFRIIAEFLAGFGYMTTISIPRRYSRHINELKNGV
jgi:hypothetical protein